MGALDECTALADGSQDQRPGIRVYIFDVSLDVESVDGKVGGQSLGRNEAHVDVELSLDDSNAATSSVGQFSRFDRFPG